jgi:predicted DNA-binding transcriptional regulator AlpA
MRKEESLATTAPLSDDPASRASKIYLTTAQLRKRWGGCSHMFIERRMKSDPKFPRPVKLGGRVRLFDLNQIEAYERSRIYAGGDEAA